jgi:hypothetical protein
VTWKVSNLNIWIYRIDKFYFLLRQMHRATFKILEKTEWSMDFVEQLEELLLDGPLKYVEA